MAKNIYQVQIALKGFKPKIWRRLLIPSDLLLSDFHKIIQTSMVGQILIHINLLKIGHSTLSK